MKKGIILFTTIIFCGLLHATINKSVSVTAGNLAATLTAAEKRSVTNLTLSGTIDARDFKFIRDSLTTISVLNIGSVSIQAYTGTDATVAASKQYPANELPESGFRKSDCSSNTTLTAITLPGSITSIGAKALQGCSGLTSLTIPASVTSIGSYAFFGCSRLTSITIPNAVKSIGTYAFTSCTGLTSITLPNSIKTIADWTFGDCTGLTGLTIPNTVTAIGAYATFGCTRLTTIAIPSSVVSIGEGAFSGCSGLVNMTIPSSINTIAKNTFSNCSGLTSISIPESVTLIDDWAFSGCSSLGKVTIPGTVKSFGFGSFSECTVLKSITFHASLKSIGDYAYFNCEGMDTIYVRAATPITLPANVFTSVNANTCKLIVPTGSLSLYKAASVWNNFPSIAEEGLAEEDMTASTIKVNITAGDLSSALTTNQKSEVTKLIVTGTIDARDIMVIRDSIPYLSVLDLSGTSIVAYSGKKGTDLLTTSYPANEMPVASFTGKQSLKSAYLPMTLTSIGSTAFYGCTFLDSIAIPNTVKTIGNSAFYCCAGLEYVTIPSSATSIGTSSFFGCGKLASLTIPAGVTTLNNYVFKGCSGLKSLSIPMTVTAIGSGALMNCTSLDSLIVYPTTPIDLSASSNVFSYVKTASCVLSVPSGTGAAYKAAKGWDVFTHIIERTETPTQVQHPTSIETANHIQVDCYPNPFVDEISIDIRQAVSAQLDVSIYTLTGKKIKTIFSSNNTDAVHLTWNGTDEKGYRVISGIYLCKINDVIKKIVFSGRN
ncbi:MAG: leucine-rich repeat protein [Bacteroidota bacterium]|nr:leucine-rich repeat protein [Bacteroidota bacterium]